MLTSQTSHLIKHNLQINVSVTLWFILVISHNWSEVSLMSQLHNFRLFQNVYVFSYLSSELCF